MKIFSFAGPSLCNTPTSARSAVQRGKNRPPCFLNDSDRGRYLSLLRQALLDTCCALHAYVLMDNHVHMLITPHRAWLDLGATTPERAVAYRTCPV